MVRRRNGQSLVEVLIAIAIGAILVTAAVALLVPALRSNAQAAKVQFAASYGRGLLDNVRVWSEGNWNSLLALATGGGPNIYYLNTASSPFATSTGTETTTTVATTTPTAYFRYFSLSDVSRDSSGNVLSNGGTYDPSTKQVTVTYGWYVSPISTTSIYTGTMSVYLVRGRNYTFYQNDWSGGPLASTSVLTVPNNQFSSSTDIDYQTTTIAVKIPGY